MIVPGQKIVVLGLGVSGRAAVRYALRCGAVVRISDLRGKEVFEAEECSFLTETNVRYETGGHTYDFLRWADMVIVSPGIDSAMPLLARIEGEGVTVIGELGLAASNISVPLVAVTGTNGKTTVTTLIGRLLQAAGKNVFVGGNIGTPLLEYVCEPGRVDVVVAEVSSFQLEKCGDFAPDIALLLNITPDHLDRHGNLEEYGRLKMKIFSQLSAGGTPIANGDDPLCRKLLDGEGAVSFFGKGRDCAAVISKDTITVSRGGRVEEYSVAGTSLAGKVGVENSAAAILVAVKLGCSPDSIQRVLCEFISLPHRLEFVAEREGVAFYNDSKATNSGAVIAALAHFKRDVVLIAGGRDKGDDYRLLRQRVGEKVVKVVAIGEAADLLAAALADIVPVVKAGTMEEAVFESARNCAKGTVVLLSPACASFDMFSSYGHRGEEFKRAVLSLTGAQKRVGMEKTG